MADSVVALWNLALSACGVSSTIADPEEKSREAELCRLWYEITRNNVLAAAPWPSVRKHSRLALTGEVGDQWAESDPEPGYRFSYAPPADLLIPYHLASYAPFSFGLVGSTRAISCDEERPILHYNAKQVDVSQWDESLKLAVVYTLATRLSAPVAGGARRLQENAALAQQLVEEAQVLAANSQDRKIELLSEQIATRGYSDYRTTRFYYPMDSLSLGVSRNA